MQTDMKWRVLRQELSNGRGVLEGPRLFRVTGGPFVGTEPPMGRGKDIFDEKIGGELLKWKHALVNGNMLSYGCRSMSSTVGGTRSDIAAGNRGGRKHVMSLRKAKATKDVQVRRMLRVLLPLREEIEAAVNIVGELRKTNRGGTDLKDEYIISTFERCDGTMMPTDTQIQHTPSPQTDHPLLLTNDPKSPTNHTSLHHSSAPTPPLLEKRRTASRQPTSVTLTNRLNKQEPLLLSSFINPAMLQATSLLTPHSPLSQSIQATSQKEDDETHPPNDAVISKDYDRRIHLKKMELVTKQITQALERSKQRLTFVQLLASIPIDQGQKKRGLKEGELSLSDFADIAEIEPHRVELRCFDSLNLFKVIQIVKKARLPNVISVLADGSDIIRITHGEFDGCAKADEWKRKATYQLKQISYHAKRKACRSRMFTLPELREEHEVIDAQLQAYLSIIGTLN